jgi:hypothetical protein
MKLSGALSHNNSEQSDVSEIDCVFIGGDLSVYIGYGFRIMEAAASRTHS